MAQDEYLWDSKLGMREQVYSKASTTCDNSLKTKGREDLNYYIRY